jgi:hypothetical protein
MAERGSRSRPFGRASLPFIKLVPLFKGLSQAQAASGLVPGRFELEYCYRGTEGLRQTFQRCDRSCRLLDYRGVLLRNFIYLCDERATWSMPPLCSSDAAKIFPMMSVTRRTATMILFMV